MTLAAILAEAERLDREATKGPWRPAGPWPTLSVIRCFQDKERPNEFTPGPPVCIVWEGYDLEGQMLAEHLDRAHAVANTDFIAFARTALPRLVAACRAAVEYRAAELAYRRTAFGSNKTEKDGWYAREAAGAAFDAFLAPAPRPAKPDGGRE